MRNIISKTTFVLALMMCLSLLFGYGSSSRVHAADEGIGVTINESIVDAAYGIEIGGAEIRVTMDNDDETLVDSWTSVQYETHKIENVAPGKYILKEPSAPLGYERVELGIKFTVYEDGRITLTGVASEVCEYKGGKLILKNKMTGEDQTGSLKFTKTVSGLDDPVLADGIKFIITGPNSYRCEFTYADIKEAGYKQIDDLPLGEYIVMESGTTIDGYVFQNNSAEITDSVEVTADNTFSAPAGLSLTNVYEKDDSETPDIVAVYISKVEVTYGPEIKGATLVITKDTMDGEVFDSWTSGKVAGETGPHKLRLSPGTYVLTEKSAPDDFHTLAESIVFTVNPDGTVTVDSATADNNTVTMIDDPAGALKITVEDDETGAGVKDAVISITTMKTNGTTETSDYLTDSDGEIYIPNLPVGNEYSYKYKTIPEKYVVSSLGEETGVSIEAKTVTPKTIKIKKNYVSTPTENQKPTSRDLRENGEEQELITAPESLPDGCKSVEYSTDDGKNWSETIPVGKEAGEYIIRVRYVADENHFTIEGEPLTVTIKDKPAPAPAKISGTLLAKMTAKGKSSLVLTWTTINGAEGYDIFFIKCGKESPKKVKTIKGNKTFKWTKKSLKKNKAYKAVVKAYVTKNGKKTYVRTSPMVHAYTSDGTSKCTNSKGVTVTKAKVSLKAGKTYKVKASVTKLQKGKKLMPTGHAPKLRYVSSNKKIATVSKSGKVTAKSKGSCKVYVIAVNGASKAVSVTVK